MLHWSQEDYDECVFVRLLNFDFSSRKNTKNGKIRKPILLCRFAYCDLFVLKAMRRCLAKEEEEVMKILRLK